VTETRDITKAQPTIRRLTEGDADALRALRLDGLKRHPAAFGVTHDEEAAKPLSFFTEWIRDKAVFGAFVDGRLVGMASLAPWGSHIYAHHRDLGAIYVHPHARGQGIADALIRASLAQAREEGAEIVELWAISENESAIRLYERHGFRKLTLIEKSKKVDGVYYDEWFMCIYL
jgi:ribosomal protein S18 acetylase RimI-like enzyme